MRLLLAFCALLLFSFSAMAQQPEAKDYPKVDVKPRFNGDMNHYLLKNLRMPPDAQEGGKVTAEFLIDKFGKVSNVYIRKKNPRDSLTSLEKEVLRVVRNMPPWIPGKLNGKNVAVRYSLPVRIK